MKASRVTDKSIFIKINVFLNSYLLLKQNIRTVIELPAASRVHSRDLYKSIVELT